MGPRAKPRHKVKEIFFYMNSETFGSQGQASHDSQDEPPLWEGRDSLRFWMFKKRFKGSNQLQIKSCSTCQKDLNENLSPLNSVGGGFIC
jgi:hypothetical protein